MGLETKQHLLVSNGPGLEYTPNEAEAQTYTGFIQPPTVHIQNIWNT
jgi:hypothetical protein